MENLNKKPNIIEGGLAIDDRGQLTFVNDFNFSDIKRFYVVENFSQDVIRAFHGHLKEGKYAFVVSGSAIVAAVEMDNTIKPNKSNEVYRFILSSRKPNILYIPAGYANGFRAIEKNTKIIFFSTSSLEESKGDDYRFPYDYWGKEIWQVENR
ncbi:MAG: dTDP-4-dehydrorhamnose 3,5-epimerase family protein [Candidatus Pacebacteria bacterium]|nr:dTDP-4-dehydrorhamnose 3,5-epimerase family protein [Candidatus Paceibacterota bacterium]